MENKGLDWETILKKMAAHSSCFQSKNKILEMEPYAHMSMAQKNMDMIESFKTIFIENGNKRVLQTPFFTQSKKAKASTLLTSTQSEFFLKT